ncbi:MAG: hypothetical protein INR81_13490 [Microcystis aeruginosa PMC 728.11]|nr:hypothetical protein [Microcystis aeruginosa]MBE5230063.1 hypothetical protein [Microcystis aeruginosa PMC 728.11]
MLTFICGDLSPYSVTFPLIGANSIGFGDGEMGMWGNGENKYKLNAEY